MQAVAISDDRLHPVIDDDKLLGMFLVSEAVESPDAFIEIALSDECNDLIVQGDLHLDMQEFITINKRGVVEYPREHGKTTQMIGRIAWEIGKNPNIRIKVVSASDNIATARGGAVRRLMETELYQSIFPHIEQGYTWTDGKLTVKRDVITPDGTLECYGIRSAATGGRADLLFLDDPDDEEVVYSDTIRQRNVDRVDNVWLNLLTPTGRAYLLCTPWHGSDIAHSRIAAGWPLLRFEIKDMVPVWPERWDTESLIEKKKDIGGIPFARGFELVVISSTDAVIKGVWFKYWNELPKMVKLAFGVDLAISSKKAADYTAIGLFGSDVKGGIYLISFIREHIDFPATLTKIVAMAESAQEQFGLTPTIGIEATAYQQAVPQTMKKGSRFPIRALTAEKNKHWRAERAGIHAENGRVYLRGNGNGGVHSEQQIVYDECVQFPGAAHDDTVDMLGYGIEMLVMRRAKIHVGRRSTKNE
jgi:predicted phage terminase large subunit-like protein